LLLYAAFLGFVCINIILFGGKEELAFITFVGLFTLTLLFILTYHSWTMDFQGQGRHAFPVVGMLAMLLGRNKDRLHGGILSSCVLVLFCLSLYSFLFAGLRFIPK
jgi:hypothetical protein